MNKDQTQKDAADNPRSAALDCCTAKPRLRFCWWCSRQLRGNNHVEVEVDGHMRVMHKQCNQWRLDGHDLPPSPCDNCEAGDPCFACGDIKRFNAARNPVAV